MEIRNESDPAEHAATGEHGERRFRNLVERTLDWIWEMNLDGKHTYSNRRVEPILGYSINELSEVPLDELIHPEDMEDVRLKLPSLIAEKKGWEGWVLRFRHKDGSYRYLESSAHPIVDAHGRVCGYSGIDRDITERHETSRRILLTESRLNEAQRIAKIGSWERDLTSGRAWWSEETYRIFGLAEDTEVTHDAFIQSVHPDDRQRVIDKVAITLRGGGPFEQDFRVQLKDGTVKTVHSRAIAEPDGVGQLRRLAGTVQDTTERVRLEREVIAIGELERTRIGADLHDGLGQELTGISLGLQTLSQKLAREHSAHARTAEGLRDMVQTAISEVRRVARILSPGFSGGMRLCEALNALAGEVAEQSGIGCHAHCSEAENHPDVETATHLYRLAQEAVNNAMKHSGARNIELHYGLVGDAIVLEILDDGGGIPEEPERVEGMGLKSMRYRASTINGRLEITPGVNGGTRVSCSVPFKPAPPARVAVGE